MKNQAATVIAAPTWMVMLRMIKAMRHVEVVEDHHHREYGAPLYSPAVVEAAADRIINAVVLQKFVNRLSEHEQSALRLMAEGYAIREIVEKLKLRKSDASRLYHLRERLRKQYENVFDTAGVV